MPILSRIGRTIALFIFSCACIAVMCFSFAVLFGLLTVLFVVVLTAYVLNPKEIRTIASFCSNQITGWLEQIRVMIASMMEIIQTMAEVARSVTQTQNTSSDTRDKTEPETKVELNKQDSN
ncbi:MAG: hypothetical protein IJ022_02080 [Burkholderiaceae bacterium]|nr:hypothetical protein [Burkholderiaceae bacterium]